MFYRMLYLKYDVDILFNKQNEQTMTLIWTINYIKF